MQKLKPVKPDEEYDPEQLKKGIEIELEHTTDKELAKTIAKHHLNEFPEYYSELKKMEKRLTKLDFMIVPIGNIYDYSEDIGGSFSGDKYFCELAMCQHPHYYESQTGRKHLIRLRNMGIEPRRIPSGEPEEQERELEAEPHEGLLSELEEFEEEEIELPEMRMSPEDELEIELIEELFEESMPESSAPEPETIHIEIPEEEARERREQRAINYLNLTPGRINEYLTMEPPNIVGAKRRLKLARKAINRLHRHELADRAWWDDALNRFENAIERKQNELRRGYTEPSRMQRLYEQQQQFDPEHDPNPTPPAGMVLARRGFWRTNPQGGQTWVSAKFETREEREKRLTKQRLKRQKADRDRRRYLRTHLYETDENNQLIYDENGNKIPRKKIRWEIKSWYNPHGLLEPVNLINMTKPGLRANRELKIHAIHPETKEDIGGANFTVREDRYGQKYLFLSLLSVPPKWQGRGAIKKIMGPIIGFLDKNNIVVRGNASPINRDIAWAPAHLTYEEKVQWQRNAFKDLVAMYKSFGGKVIGGSGTGYMERTPHPERFGLTVSPAQLNVGYWDFISDFEEWDDVIEIDIDPEYIRIMGNHAYYYDVNEDQFYMLEFKKDMKKLDFKTKYIGNIEDILTEDKKDKRPPKEWWNACVKTIKKGNPDYTDEQIDKTCGMIYHQRGVREKMGDFTSINIKKSLRNDMVDVSKFKNLVLDYKTTDFTVYKGPITREGHFDYYKNGKQVRVFKQWDNILEQFDNVDYLPLKAVVGEGSHHANIEGFVTNFKPEKKPKEGNKYRQMYGEVVLLNDIYGHPEAIDLNDYHVSIGFEDEIIGNKQIIKKLDHLAMSDKEVGRCSTADGDPCIVKKVGGSKTE